MCMEYPFLLFLARATDQGNRNVIFFFFQTQYNTNHYNRNQLKLPNTLPVRRSTESTFFLEKKKTFLKAKSEASPC